MTHQPPARLNDYVRFSNTAVNVEGDITQFPRVDEAEPVRVEQELKKKHLKEVILDELKLNEKNKTWKLVHLPQDKKCFELGFQDQTEAKWSSSKLQGQAN
jgi:hypothetical protein